MRWTIVLVLSSNMHRQELVRGLLCQWMELSFFPKLLSFESFTEIFLMRAKMWRIFLGLL